MEWFLHIGRCRSQDPDSARGRTQTDVRSLCHCHQAKRSKRRSFAPRGQRRSGCEPLGLATSAITRSLEQTCWRPRRSGVSDGPGYGNLVSGRCRRVEKVFRSAVQAERTQAMASVGRRPQSDCDRGASKSDRGMREALCQRPDLVRVAPTVDPARVEGLPSSQGALGSSPGAVTEHHPHAGRCGGRAVGAEIMSAHIDYVPTFSRVEESNVGSCM